VRRNRGPKDRRDRRNRAESSLLNGRKVETLTPAITVAGRVRVPTEAKPRRYEGQTNDSSRAPSADSLRVATTRDIDAAANLDPPSGRASWRSPNPPGLDNTVENRSVERRPETPREPWRASSSMVLSTPDRALKRMVVRAGLRPTPALTTILLTALP
jgi:hypothetical protein